MRRTLLALCVVAGAVALWWFWSRDASSEAATASDGKEHSSSAAESRSTGHGEGAVAQVDPLEARRDDSTSAAEIDTQVVATTVVRNSVSSSDDAGSNSSAGSAASNLNPSDSDASSELYVDGEPTVCSMRTELRTAIQFINDCDAPIDVSWIDFNCRERVYFEMKPGDHIDEPTYVTHTWRIRDHATQKLLQQAVAMSEGTELRACGDHTVANRSPDASVPDDSFCAPSKVVAADPPLCSVKWKTAAVDILFVNNCLGTTVSLNWVDYDCKERPYGLLNTGAQRKQQTFVTHTWRIRDASTGELYREFVPRSPNSIAVATCQCAAR